MIAPIVLALAALAVLYETFRASPNGYVFLAAVPVAAVALLYLGDAPADAVEEDR